MAAALAEMGARVAITARKRAELDEARRTLGAQGYDVLPFESDLSKAETLGTLVDDVVRRLGPIDILVNNAGTSWGAAAEEYPLDAWQKVIDLNLTGTWELTRQVASRLHDPTPLRTHHQHRLRSQRLRGSAPAISKRSLTAPAKAVIISLTRALWPASGAYTASPSTPSAPGFIPSKMSHARSCESIGEVRHRTPRRYGSSGTDDDMKGLVVLLAGAAARHITGQTFCRRRRSDRRMNAQQPNDPGHEPPATSTNTAVRIAVLDDYQRVALRVRRLVAGTRERRTSRHLQPITSPISDALVVDRLLALRYRCASCANAPHCTGATCMANACPS